MIVQSACQISACEVSACQAPAPRLLASENLSRPNRPRCGSVLLVAEESRFETSAANAMDFNAMGSNAMGRIDHVWSCDCGNKFATSIQLHPR